MRRVVAYLDNWLSATDAVQNTLQYRTSVVRCGIYLNQGNWRLATAKFGSKADHSNDKASYQQPQLDNPLEKLLPKIAVVGRPNVGKSALFNRLVGKRLALVHDTPESHVTRDWKEGLAKLGDLRFTVIDTCGIEPLASPHSIQGRGSKLTGAMLRDVDMAMMVIDARAGVTGPDEELASWLSRYRTRASVLLVANKAEGNKAQQVMEQTVADCYRLGFGDPVAVSAATGEGMTDLYVALQPHVDAAVVKLNSVTHRDTSHNKDTVDATSKEENALVPASQQKSLSIEGVSGSSMPVRLAIIGLPNAGKSTLLNQLLGHDRVVTGPEPGLTRDPIAATMEYQGITIQVVDTAGYIGQTKVANYDDSGGDVAAAARHAGLTSIARSAVVLLVVDAAAALKSQKVLSSRELSLVSKVLSEGRPLIVAANKIDAMPGPREKAMYLNTLRERLAERLKEAGVVHVIDMCAASGEGVDKIMPAVLYAHKCWSTRIGAGQLNRWLRQDVLPKFSTGGSIAFEIKRIKYISQIRTCPPTFVCFATGSRPVAERVHEYLGKQLRAAFQLQSTPVQFWFRYRTRDVVQPRRRLARRRQPALPPSWLPQGSRTDSGLPSSLQQPNTNKLTASAIRKHMQQRANAAGLERQLSPLKEPARLSVLETSDDVGSKKLLLKGASVAAKQAVA